MWRSEEELGVKARRGIIRGGKEINGEAGDISEEELGEEAWKLVRRGG